MPKVETLRKECYQTLYMSDSPKFKCESNKNKEELDIELLTCAPYAIYELVFLTPYLNKQER